MIVKEQKPIEFVNSCEAALRELEGYDKIGGELQAESEADDV